VRIVHCCAPLLALLIAGCSTGTRISPTALPPSSYTSRDGGLQYQLPSGWFDATADSQATGHVVLLIRNDYGATIAVDKVHLDANAREQLHQGGLLEVAQVLMSLSSWDRGTVLMRTPRLLTLDDKEVCRYIMTVTATQDQLQVTLLDTGRNVYAVNVLLSGKVAVRDGELDALQDNFIGSLRW